MIWCFKAAQTERVALLAEGVDRNCQAVPYDLYDDRSPSSRRAWIEIQYLFYKPHYLFRRPPRGGRG